MDNQPKETSMDSPKNIYELIHNIVARLREAFACACCLYLATKGLVSGYAALVGVGLIVLPIELTRQLMKGSVAKTIAKLSGNGGLVALLLVGASYLPTITTMLPIGYAALTTIGAIR